MVYLFQDVSETGLPPKHNIHIHIESKKGKKENCYRKHILHDESL